MRNQWLLCYVPMALFASTSSAEEPVRTKDVFARDNLVAWCIVPFDASKRGPSERAEMLNRLGLKALAYDYRDEHIPQFDEEIAALKAHGIQLTGWWCGGVDPRDPVSGSVTLALDALRRNQQSSDLWVMFSEGPLAPLDQAQRVTLIAGAMDKIAGAAADVKGRVGIYNHGGWCGDPRNQIAVVKACREPNVGIVYNFHHGHEHLALFPEILEDLRPYLLCLNLNGMTAGGEKILPIGKGKEDARVLKMIRQSGYEGPIGILDHRPDLDAEQSLQENLDGLERLTKTGL